MFHGLGQMDLSGLRPLPRRVGQWCRRRRSRLVFAVLCLSLLLVLRAVLKLRPSRESIEMAGTVNELMKLPPKGYVNLGVAALSLAKEHYRDLDVAAADRQIDGLAFRIKSLAEDLKGRGVADPETTAMNRVLFEEEGFKYLVLEHYVKSKREPKSVHPRDLLDQVIDLARYLEVEPRLSKELIDAAVEAYFVKM